LGSLSLAKRLCGIGSILTLLLLVPANIEAVLVIVGWILILVAVKRIADEAHDSSIFNNALIAAVLAIIGIIIFAVIVAAAFLSLVGLGSLSSANPPPAGVIGVILGALAGLAVVWILGIVGSFFLWRSFKGVGDKTSVNMFRTAGLVYFIGSILTIILVGFFAIFVAQILFIVAFFSLPDNLPGPSVAQTQPMVPSS
jgi:uncharacterized membrane protein